MPTPPIPATPRGRRVVSFLLLFAGALAVKGSVLRALHAHPLLQPAPEMDGGVYLGLARHGVPAVPYFVSPLYLYFLKLAGASVPLVAALQVILGSAGVVLLFDTARRWFGPRGAWLSAVLLLFTGVVTFDEIAILQSALDPFLVALLLWTLTIALQSHETPRTLPRYAAAGGAAALFALNRPNAMLWVAAACLLFLWQRRLKPLLAFVAGCAFVLAPVAIRNYAVAGELVLVSSHGGLNFYIGNNAEADGTYHAVRGIRPTIAGQSVDSIRVASAAAGHPLTAGETSRWFYRQAFDWIGAHPAAALGLFARKLAYTVNETDLALNFSYDYFRHDVASPLRLLIVGPWLLVPLGFAGAMTRLRDRAFLLWAAFVPVYAISVALFFVASRYRLPLLLPLAVCAGGILELRRSGRSLAIAAGVAAVAGAVALWPVGLDSGRSGEQTNMVVSLIESQRAAEAAELIARVAPGHHEPARLYLQAGLAYEQTGESARAIDAFEHVVRAPSAQPVLRSAATGELAAQYVRTGRPDEARRLLASIDDAPLDAARATRLGRLAMQLHAGADAVRFFAVATQHNPDDPAAWRDLGMAELARGNAAQAIPALTRARRLGPADASAYFVLALAYAQTGDLAEARRNAAEALRLQPDFPEAQALMREFDAQRPAQSSPDADRSG